MNSDLLQPLEAPSSARTAISFLTPITPGTRRTSASAAGLLVRPIDFALQGDPAAVHSRADPVTWNCEIPMKRVCDFGANIRHGASFLFVWKQRKRRLICANSRI